MNRFMAGRSREIEVGRAGDAPQDERRIRHGADQVERRGVVVLPVVVQRGPPAPKTDASTARRSQRWMRDSVSPSL